jgi:DNA-3-methyladenine glycosylase
VRITETEAYLGPHDPASHAVRGCTPATRALFGAPGTLYVYRSYGLHWCANAVTAPDHYGAAVLLRAGEPVSGDDVMRARRGDRVRPHELAAGPGRLAAALGLTRDHDGAPLIGGAVTIREAAGIADDDVLVTPRIGITRAADWPLRYVVRNSRHVSRTPGRFLRQEYRRCLPLPSGAVSAPPPPSPSS